MTHGGVRYGTGVFFQPPLDILRVAAYTSNMNAEKPPPTGTPCLCFALRQASRAVSRVYDEELRGVGLRNTQYSLLIALHRSGEVRQGDLGAMTVLDETTLTRNLRPLADQGWVAVRAGRTGANDWFRSRRPGGPSSPRCARRGGAQERLQSSVPKGIWESLMIVLPEVRG